MYNIYNRCRVLTCLDYTVRFQNKGSIFEKSKSVSIIADLGVSACKFLN